jgi:hypothetical protein
MQKSHLFSSLNFRPKVKRYLAVFSFLLIASILFSINTFPALYGDEYDSLSDAHHLAGNIHAIGYFTQLYLWSSIFNSDWFLRILSILWLGAGLFWLNSWLKEEQISPQTRILTIGLALLNPFLWMYGFQIRFYAMFFAASILFIWRFRVAQQKPTSRNKFFLALSMVLLLTAHLFGLLVLFTALLVWLWSKAGNKKWYLLVAVLLAFIVIILPPVHRLLVDLVYRVSNPYAPLPQDAASRGLSLAMFAKVPLTFYFFIFGERIYPLMWWVTIPGTLIVGIAFVLGLWNLRRLPGGLGSLSVFMLLNVPLLFLVLDPLAPPGLQGAAPRYVIFVLPYLLIIVAWGAQVWKPLYPALVMLFLICLYFLAKPVWSFDSSNLVNWSQILKDAVSQPAQTCVITDGRAQDPVARYIPAGTKVAYQGKVADCSGYSRIVLVSNDFRLSQVRYFDGMSDQLNSSYKVVSNVTLFPAQVTTYQQTNTSAFQVIPSRLDLPEQDLMFPVSVPSKDWKINGFMRLDNQRTSIQITPPENMDGHWYVLTDYRSDTSVRQGTPIFSLKYANAAGFSQEIILSEGRDTSTWNGYCGRCLDVASWTKLVSLVGTYYYPGAYNQFQAHIWGATINVKGPVTSLQISYLLPGGTGYFWGIFQ